MADETCGNCLQRIGEECGIDGHEVYEDDDASDCCYFYPEINK